MKPEELIQAARNQLSADGRRDQRAIRTSKLTMWLWQGIPQDQILRMTQKLMKMSKTAAEKLFADLILNIREQSVLIEQRPLSEQRHYDRLMLQSLHTMALKKGNMNACIKIAGMMLKMNGTDSKPDRAIGADVNANQRAARGAKHEELIEILKSGQSREYELPS